MKHFLFNFVSIASGLLLAACGGGGGGGGTSLPQTMTLTVSAGVHTAGLSWSSAPAMFNVYQDGAQVTANIVWQGGVGSSTLTGLSGSTRYCLEVHSQPVAGGPEDGRSNEVCFFTQTTPPTDLKLDAKGSDTITLQWKADDTGQHLRSFQITRDDNVTFTVDASVRNYDDTGLARETEHCYVIRAVDDRGQLSDQSFIQQRCITTGWRNVVVATPDTGRYPVDPALALDPAGSPAIVYVVADTATGSSGELWLARPAGDSWNRQRIAVTASHPTIAIDAVAVVHVAYFDATASKLIHATSAGGWTPDVIDDVDADVAPSIAVDGAANVHIVYRSAGNVRYATNRSGNWTKQSIAPGAISYRDAIAVDATGRPYVGLLAADGDVQVATGNASGWSIETAFASFGGGMCGLNAPSIALSSGNDVHLGVQETCMVSGAASHAQRFGGVWHEDSLDPGDAGGAFRVSSPTITVSNNVVHIAAVETISGINTSIVRYWNNSTASWPGYTLANDAASPVSLRVDASSNRHATYRTYQNPPNEIRYLTTRP